MDFVTACKELISIDTSPSNGTRDACEFLKNLAESMGFQVELEEEVQRGFMQANIMCFPGEPQKEVALMLQTHLDTVDPGPFALWEKNGT